MVSTRDQSLPINILNNVVFMCKIPTKTAPSAFHSRFHPIRIPPILQSPITHYLPTTLKAVNVCNNLLTRTEKPFETMSLFNIKIKNKSLVLEHEAKYFQ